MILSAGSPIEIRSAVWPDDRPVVRALFVEYAAGIGVDLSFQDFDAEVAGLPGRYAPPTGALVIAWRGATAVGCIAMRPLGGGDCEMKRLYVRPSTRGDGVGRALVEAIVRAARAAGHRRMCLDSLPTMVSAVALYRACGFEPIAPYTFNPIAGTVYLARDLAGGHPDDPV